MLNFQFAADLKLQRTSFKYIFLRRNLELRQRTHFSSGSLFSPGTGATGRLRPSVKFTLQVHTLLSCLPVAPWLRHWACRPAGSCGREWTPSSRSGAAAVWEGGRKEGRGGWMMRSLSLCSRRTAWPCPLPAMSRAPLGGGRVGGQAGDEGRTQGFTTKWESKCWIRPCSGQSECLSFDSVLRGFDCLPKIRR